MTGRHIENIVIGKLLCEPHHLFSNNEEEWETQDKEVTLFTEERFLPKILVELGVYPSLSEIRRNRKDLCVTLDNVDFIDKLKVAKRTFLWIAVGE